MRTYRFYLCCRDCGELTAIESDTTPASEVDLICDSCGAESTHTTGYYP